ncbi:MAG: UDP-N-acetylmuramoyl-tripeptide--D-alanyl-D-alanine ligase [Oscillospiraceae bacterium]|nr:UDP-N-acetylmuramoyl-tripeptide--D-alanyl-D-alanine ligase [Oscillospiraceae bacterium]
MIAISVSSVAQILKAKMINIDADYDITGVSTDSRSVKPGEIFFALRGDKFDGHDFIASLPRGVCAVAERDTGSGAPMLLVNDTYEALGKLGMAIKDKLSLKHTVGITGSVGKTTTKEFVACILKRSFDTHSTPGNYNNRIGLPLTLAGLTEQTEALVCEMGMSAPGEIDYLSSLCHPDIAIITNIGISHIENLGSREAIRDAKLEITRHMKPGSVIILNGDEPLLRDEAAINTCKSRKLKVIYAGFGPNNDIYPSDILNNHRTVSFDIITESCERRIVLPAVGDHFVMNALFAFAAGQVCGVSPDEIQKGLAEYKPQGLRQKIYVKNGITVIADCYNAGPESMTAALKVIGNYDKRRIAVLGDMLELGLMSTTAHRAVGKEASARIDYMFAYGKAAADIVKGACEAGLASDKCFFFEDKTSLSDTLGSFIKPGDTILFKASRRMKLEDVIDSLGLSEEI